MQRDHLTRRHCCSASLTTDQQHGSQRAKYTHDALPFPPDACPDGRGIWRRRCGGFTVGRHRDARGNLRVLGLVRAHTKRPVLMTNLLTKASSGNVTEYRRAVVHLYWRELKMHAEEGPIWIIYAVGFILDELSLSMTLGNSFLPSCPSAPREKLLQQYQR